MRAQGLAVLYIRLKMKLSPRVLRMQLLQAKGATGVCHAQECVTPRSVVTLPNPSQHCRM